MVGIPALFMNLTEVTDLTSIGTLFAFLLVCGGVLRLNPYGKSNGKSFTTPYVSSRYIFPSLLLIVVAGLWHFKPEVFSQFFSLGDPLLPGATVWEVVRHKIPLGIYLISMMVLTGLCALRNFSLIPVLGLASCGYLMTELGWTNWLRFSLWLIAGSFIYFLYGFRNSRLRKLKDGRGAQA